MNKPSESSTPRHEVVGVLHDRKGFEGAVRALLEAGFDRTDLSVLTSHESLDAAESPERGWSDVIPALVGEIKVEVPLVASGAIVLAGGATAATIAALVGAAVGGMAVKEVLDEVLAKPHSADFARALAAGSIILWVRIPYDEKESTAASILRRFGAANVHTLAASEHRT